MRPTREMYEKEIAELKDVELQLLLEIAELKAEVNYWCDPETPNVVYTLEKE